MPSYPVLEYDLVAVRHDPVIPSWAPKNRVRFSIMIAMICQTCHNKQWTHLLPYLKNAKSSIFSQSPTILQSAFTRLFVKMTFQHYVSFHATHRWTQPPRRPAARRHPLSWSTANRTSTTICDRLPTLCIQPWYSTRTSALTIRFLSQVVESFLITTIR